MSAPERQAAPLQFPGLNNRGLKFLSVPHRVGMTIYPQPTSNVPFMNTDRGTAALKIDWDPDNTVASVLGFQWDKLMGHPSGKWSARVKAKKSSSDSIFSSNQISFDDQEISDGDWIDIAILRNNQRIPLCRGVVDSVRKQTRSVDGATVAVYALTGRDHGAFFEYPITWQSVWAQTLHEMVSGLFTRRIGGKVGGRPDEMFEWIINATFKGGEKHGVPSGQWLVPPALQDVDTGDKLADLLKIVAFNAIKGQPGLRGVFHNQPSLWSVGEQPLFQTLGQWVNPLLNEFWCDLAPPGAFMPRNGLNAFLKNSDFSVGKLPTSTDQIFVDDAGTGAITFPPTLTLESENAEFGTATAFIRERPFPTTAAKKDSMWFSLPTWRLPTWLISDSDLGRAGGQRFNLFELLADYGSGPQKEQAAYAQPKWLKESIATHGLRPYSKSTKFFAANPMNWGTERANQLDLLVDWFAPNPYLIGGTIVVAVPLPEVRIGHRLIVTDEVNPSNDIQFYVEGVGISMRGPTQSSGTGGQTTLILTRGFRGTDEELMAATVDLAAQYKKVF